MALASLPKVVLGCIAFAVFWVMAVFPSVPLLPIGRTAGSLLSAVLMVIFRVISPDDAYASIDLPILVLLFSTMVVGSYLKNAGMFKHLGTLLAWKCQGGRDLLCRVCVVSAIASALFTNDTCCVVLTEFVLELVAKRNLPAKPFLLALATSSNIGSSVTAIGNPQNLVIIFSSHISFPKFLVGILPAMLAGMAVNTGLLLCMNWKILEGASPDLVEAGRQMMAVDVEEGRSSCVPSPDSSQSLDGSAINHDGESMKEEEEEEELEGVGRQLAALEEGRSPPPQLNGSNHEGETNQQPWFMRWKEHSRKVIAYVVTLCMVVGYMVGLNMPWTAMTAAIALIVVDFRDAEPCVVSVSYSLLVFFSGMFVTVSGFNKTGLPSAIWNLIAPYSKVDTGGGMAVLSIIIMVLSNIASNVPTVILMGTEVATAAALISPAAVTRSWLLLAWVSTVAGNLSLLGSAANLIVCEQARRAPQNAHRLTFWNHLAFGVPSTLMVTAIGIPLLGRL